MEFPASSTGYFTITALSFTPQVIAPGETAQLSVTLKNTSGVAVTKCRAELNGKYKSSRADGRNGSMTTVYLHGSNDYSSDYGMAAISWGRNISHTFTGTVKFSINSQFPLDTSSYFLDLTNSNFTLSLTTNAAFANGSNYENIYGLRGTNGEYLAMLSARDNPTLAFSVARTPDDEGTALVTGVKLSSDSGASALSEHGYIVKLYSSSEHDPATTDDTPVTLNCTLAELCAGVTGSTAAITQTFPNGSDYAFLLQVTNGYETVSAFSDIARAFANVHMSGCPTGGVAFGKFSAATENRPLFECTYPAHFQNGIYGADGRRLDAEDTGWIDLPLADNVTAHDASFAAVPRYRRIANRVYVRGHVSTAVPSGGRLIAQLPEGFRPSSGTHYDIGECGGQRISRFYIDVNGNLRCEWVYTIGGSAYTSALWIQIDMDFLTD